MEGLKEKYDREVAEEEDEIAMGKDYTKTLNPFIEVRFHSSRHPLKRCI